MDAGQEAQLTLEAKQAIRKYILSLFVWPAVITSAVIGFTGYLIGTVWTAKAYQEASALANSAIQKAYVDAHNRTQEATLSYIGGVAKKAAEAESVVNSLDAIKVDVEIKRKQISNIIEESVSILKELDAHRAAARAGIDMEAIAQALKTSPGFLDIVVSRTSADINQLARRIDNITIRSRPSPDSTPFGCGGEHKAPLESSVVMFGSKDGTSCGVPNKNYYKELYIEVPR